MKILQLTNLAIGAVAVDTLLPLGTVTRRFGCGNTRQSAFAVSTANANTITINEPGYYYINYSASLSASGAGDVILNLLVNGETVLTKTETASAVGFVDITVPYIVRVLPCVPVTIQVENDEGSVAITTGTSNVTVTKL